MNADAVKNGLGIAPWHSSHLNSRPPGKAKNGIKVHLSLWPAILPPDLSCGLRGYDVQLGHNPVLQSSARR